MSKNIRRILAASAVLVVLVLAFVLLKYVFPEKEVLPEPSPSPSEAPSYYLFRRSASEVSGFTCFYEDGSQFEVDLLQENGEERFAVSPEDTFFGYSDSRLRSLLYTVSSVMATSLIEEDPKDLADYGLDEPQFTLTVRFTDGDSVTVSLGNQTPVQNYYYAVSDRENTVYTIGGYLTGLMTRKPYEYRDVDTFPSYKEKEDIYTSIDHFRLTQRDGTPIEIFLDKDFSMEGNIASSNYMMTQPLVSPCTADTVEALLDVLATNTMEAILGDITKDQLAEYGLDRPARLYLEDILGNKLELVIGSVNEGRCVAAIARQYEALLAGETDYLTLISYTEENFDWLTLNYMSLQIRTPWIVGIRDAASVTYDFDGDVYEMELYEYDDVTGSGLPVVRTCSHINGKDINETNTKRIYNRTLNFRQVGSLPEGAEYEESYSNSIIIRLKDGSQRVMTFHRMNERQYACALDGTVEYYIYAGNLSNLRTALERAMDDREVPLVYVR